jgi:hypothetical protein
MLRRRACSEGVFGGEIVKEEVVEEEGKRIAA